MKNKLILLLLFVSISHYANAQVLLNSSLGLRSLVWLLPILFFIVFAIYVISYGLKVKREFEKSDTSNDEDLLMNHNYDGIEELDNNLPKWWLYGFYLTIFFAATYMVDYHVLKSSPLSEGEYLAEMSEANAMIQENTVEIAEEDLVPSESDIALENGKKIFNTNCLACHGPDGGGTVGPNLTDEYWIHGGSYENIYTTILNGVPEKGMISWQPVLRPNEIQEVTSYIMNLEYVEGKAPEGEIYAE